MKYLILAIIPILLWSCEIICKWEYKNICYGTYTNYIEARISDMTSPVEIIWISDEWFGWRNVSIKDWSWTILTIWNMATQASTLWSRKIWDIIK